MPRKPKRALEAAKRACSLKHGAACTLAGKIIASGEAVIYDDNLAQTFFKKACLLRDDDGCELLQ